VSAQIERPATDLVNIEVDGRALQAQKGQMLIEVTDAAGITIPRFCYHKHLSVAANCRMCLVDVEKAPKPLPACATPVSEGMRVWTHSARARDAQKGTMEFLLINHPLDCPICDQGGECELQDLSVGYGKDVSRYHELKRVVRDKNLGPLIATEMTRCIHCTRCVRFGEEIAGAVELGATGRGEHTEIGTYIEQSVDSELSGNVIDLCPVGALTSKPFRYQARPWELDSHRSIAPHDCIGSNIDVQVRRNEVMRVLPRENDEVNECWISDRDRFSYESLGVERLLRPAIRVDGVWRETDWRTALEFAAAGLRQVLDRHGPGELGALAAPQAMVEEFFLLQKLMRGLGSNHVDHRLRARDFRDDDKRALFPALGRSLRELERLRAVLLVGANLRKDQPLLNHRVRKACRAGARVMALNPVDFEFNYDLHARRIVTPPELPQALARIVRVAGGKTGKTLPAGLDRWCAGEADSSEQAIADALLAGEVSAVILGNLAATDSQASVLRALASHLAQLTGSSFGILGEGNSAGAWLAGCVPHREPGGRPVSARGRDARSMLSEPLKGYILFGLEPELDCGNGSAARRALSGAEFVVAIGSFQKASADHAHVLLPMGAFAETEGSHVNCEGRWQDTMPAVMAPGEARPGWKILRVLGNQLGLAGFGYATAAEVRAEVESDVRALSEQAPGTIPAPPPAASGLSRIGEVPPYRGDPCVRRAPALQATRDNPGPAVRLNAREIKRLGLAAGSRVRARSASGEAVLELVADARVPDRAVLIPAGYPDTAELGDDETIELAAVPA